MYSYSVEWDTAVRVVELVCTTAVLELELDDTVLGCHFSISSIFTSDHLDSNA